jgi:hypothetical protein
MWKAVLVDITGDLLYKSVITDDRTIKQKRRSKMKRILLIILLIVGMTAAYSFAQMGQGGMGHGMMGGQTQQPAQTPYSGGYYPCPMEQGMTGYGGYGME